MAQIDPIQRDVNASLAARVHADEPGRTVEVAERVERDERTVRNWKSDGHGSPVDRFGQYMMTHPEPFRLVSHVKALAKREAINNLTRAQLIVRYRELLKTEKPREAEDTVLDMGGKCWLDCAAASERDAAIDEEKAAICRRFAELRITRADIWGNA